LELRKKFTPEPLDKWRELLDNINPIGKRDMFYAYTIDSSIN
jgi:hypothetical protein